MKNKQKKGKKKKSILRSFFKFLLILFLIILIAIGSFIGYSTYKNGWGLKGILSTIVGQDEEKLKDLDRIDILILGVSTDISVELTDTIIVASYDPKTQTASMLSIPRDTFVGKNKNKANSYDKINALYQKGIDNTLQKVNELTGLDIKYYIVVKTEALVKLVDAIGGVEFDVPIDMTYDDTSQDLHIDLKKGFQKLDGNQAEQLVRFRKNNNGTTYSTEYGDNDTGRMRTQREFLIQVLKQTVRAKNIFKIRQLLDIAYEYVITNISLDVAKDYVPYLVDFDADTMRTEVLPGENGILGQLWFFVPSEKKIKELIDDMYKPVIEEDEELEDLASNEENKEEKKDNYSEKKSNVSSKIRVELLNGTGDSSRLAKAEKILKEKGYDVKKKNQTNNTSKTVIINKTNNSNEKINDLKTILNVKDITKSYIENSDVDVTIILGNDYI